MVEHDCGEIPVCDAGKLVGVVTDRDMMVRTVAKGRDPVGVAVRQVMTAKVFTVRATIAWKRRCQSWSGDRCGGFPSSSHSRGKLVGIISQADIAETLPEQKAGELLFEISHPAGKPPKRVMLLHRPTGCERHVQRHGRQRHFADQRHAECDVRGGRNGDDHPSAGGGCIVDARASRGGGDHACHGDDSAQRRGTIGWPRGDAHELRADARHRRHPSPSQRALRRRASR